VSKTDFAQNPLDGDIQKRLKALLDLQSILQSQKLPPEQIALIKTQVTQLSEASKVTPKAAPKPPTPVPAPAQPQQQRSLNSILGPGALAALRQSATPQPTPPTQTRSPQPVPSQPFNPPPVSMASTPVPDPNSLLERLRAAGLLPGAPATSTPTPLSSFPANVSGYPPPFVNTPPNLSRTPLGEIPNDVVLKTSSLKM
jgi:pre-mRNA cleavage complex 2 protein Pcf11